MTYPAGQLELAEQDRRAEVALRGEQHVAELEQGARVNPDDPDGQP
jgi:hypothetical protein